MSARADIYAGEREKWRNFPRVRPSNVVPADRGQESVWDYPRPPRVESVAARVRVEFGGRVIAESTRALRVCETSSPPVYYLPPPDVDLSCLMLGERTSFSFYPRRMDACFVGEHRVTPQPGFYYGGWVTPDLVGPFKGIPGSEAW